MTRHGNTINQEVAVIFVVANVCDYKFKFVAFLFPFRKACLELLNYLLYYIFLMNDGSGMLVESLHSWPGGPRFNPASLQN